MYFKYTSCFYRMTTAGGGKYIKLWQWEPNLATRDLLGKKTGSYTMSIVVFPTISLTYVLLCISLIAFPSGGSLLTTANATDTHLLE